MKIGAVIVGTDHRRFRSTTANVERRALAVSIADYAIAEQIQLVLLPAGFLTATSSTRSAIRTAANELARIFRGCDLLAGVDAPRTTRSNGAKHRARRTRTYRWPFWAFGATQGIVQDPIFQQRTVYPGETTTDTEGRVLSLSGAKVGLLICGEVYNPDLVEGLFDHRPDFVVDLGHLSMGRGFTRTLFNAASTVGCNLYHCQHVALRSDAAKWMSTPKRASQVWNHDWASYDRNWNGRDLWAEVKVWNV